MPKELEDAVNKCVKAMIAKGIEAKEAKGRCIGRFKNLGIIEKKKAGLKLTKKGKKKLED